MDLVELQAWEAKEREKDAAAAAEAQTKRAARGRRVEAWAALFRLCDWASNPNGDFDPAPLRTIREVLTDNGQWEHLVAVHERIKGYEHYDGKAAFCITSAILDPDNGEALLRQGAKFANWKAPIGLGTVLNDLKFDIEHNDVLVKQEREARELQERQAAEAQSPPPAQPAKPATATESVPVETGRKKPTEPRSQNVKDIIRLAAEGLDNNAITGRLPGVGAPQVRQVRCDYADQIAAAAKPKKPASARKR